MALRFASDRRWGGAASGMPDPEMCVSGGDFLCLSGVLDAEKVKRGNGYVENGFVKKTETTRRKRIRKASLYSSSCSASHLRVIITKTDVNIVL